MNVVDLSEIYSKRSRNPSAAPSYYAVVEREFMSYFLCRYYVRIYDRNSISLVASTFVTTKWGAARWAKRWVKNKLRDNKRAAKDKKGFYIDLD